MTNLDKNPKQNRLEMQMKATLDHLDNETPYFIQFVEKIIFEVSPRPLRN